jgi:hypothetical protein
MAQRSPDLGFEIAVDNLPSDQQRLVAVFAGI